MARRVDRPGEEFRVPEGLAERGVTESDLRRGQRQLDATQAYLARGGARAAKSPSKRRGKGRKKTLEERLKTEPGLLERMRRDPGLRSKLPDRYLTAEQRRQRRRNKVNKAIGDPLASLDGVTLQDLAKQMTDADFKPLYQELDQAQAEATQEGQELARRAAEYFARLNAENQARTVAQNTATQQQDQLLAGIAGQTGQAIQSAQQQGQQAIAQDAALRGQGLQADSTQDLVSRMAQAQAQNAQASGISRQGAAQTGFNAETLARQMQTAGGQLGGEVQSDLGRRTQGALQSILDKREGLLDEQKGAYLKTLMALRDRQGEMDLAQRQILGDVQAAQAEAAGKAAEAQAEQEAAGEEINEWGYTEKEWRALSTEERRRIMREDKQASSRGSGKGSGRSRKPGSGLGSRTQAQQRPYVSAIGELSNAIRRGMSRREAMKRAPGTFSPGERRVVANAANDMAKLGYLSPTNAKALQSIGINVRGFPRSQDAAAAAGTLPTQTGPEAVLGALGDFFDSIVG